jgi:hypothetical protein
METRERSFTAQTKCGNLSSWPPAQGQNHPGYASRKTVFPTGQISENRTKSGPQKVKTAQNPVCHRMTVVDGGYHLNTLFRGVKKDMCIMQAPSPKGPVRVSVGRALINTGFQTRTAPHIVKSDSLMPGTRGKSGGTYSLRTALIQPLNRSRTGVVQVKTGLIRVNTAKYR